MLFRSPIIGSQIRSAREVFENKLRGRLTFHIEQTPAQKNFEYFQYEAKMASFQTPQLVTANNICYNCCDFEKEAILTSYRKHLTKFL